MRSILSVPLLLALASVVVPVLAGERDRDPDVPDTSGPATWRYVTHSAKTTTSKCIGSAKTPLCAMDTALACYVRGQAELCKIADDYGNEQEPGTFEQDRQTAAQNPEFKYRIIAAKRMDAEDVHESKSNPTYHHGPLDVHEPWDVGSIMIVMQFSECTPAPKHPRELDCSDEPAAPPTRVYLRKARGHWVASLVEPRY
jgi:hypothetical protein